MFIHCYSITCFAVTSLASLDVVQQWNCLHLADMIFVVVSNKWGSPFEIDYFWVPPGCLPYVTDLSLFIVCFSCSLVLPFSPSDCRCNGSVLVFFTSQRVYIYWDYNTVCLRTRQQWQLLGLAEHMPRIIWVYLFSLSFSVILWSPWLPLWFSARCTSPTFSQPDTGIISKVAF